MKNLFLALLIVPSLLAQPAPELIERYEAVLERNPSRGAAFEKIYLEYLEAGEPAALRERWEGKAKDAESPAAAGYVLLLGYLDERASRIPEAREAFRKYTELAPDRAEGWLALAALDQRAGELGEAAASYRKALELTENSDERIRLYRDLALVLERQFRGEESLKVWRELAAEYEEDADVSEEVADALLQSGKRAEARTLLEKVLAKLDLDAFRKVGIEAKIAGIEERDGKTAEAIRRYDALLASTSATSWLHRDLRARIEAVYRRQDDLPGLVEYYQKRLKENPRDIEAAVRLADVLRDLKRPAEALDWLRQATEWGPDREGLQLAYADLLLANDRFDDAIEVLKRLVREQPDSRDYREQLGEAYWEKFRQSNDDASRKLALDTWAELAPVGSRNAGEVVALGTLLESRDFKAEARAQFERALELDPRASDVRERLAFLLIEGGRKDEAWPIMDGIVPGKGAEVRDFLQLTRLQQRVRRDEEARKTLDRGLEAFPKNADLLGLKLELLLAGEQWDAALAVCDDLLAGASSPEATEEFEKRKAQVLVALKRGDAIVSETLGRISSENPPSAAGLRLALRILSSASLGDDGDSTGRIAEEAEKRFPDDVGLLKLRVSLAAREENPDEQGALLRRLAGLDAARRADWLREIAQACLSADREDDAMAALQESIDASPADPAGYVAAADVAVRANRIEEAALWYRKASELSDRPADPLTRLGGVYLGTGKTNEAISVFEEAFEAEEESQARLAIVKQLASAYVQSGKTVEIIDRFERRQSAEGEGGWRYALYLSEIYQRLGDYAQARQELDLALAARPQDASLIRQLIQIAERERNNEVVEKYTRMLVKVEPGEDTELSLAGVLLKNGKHEEARKYLTRYREDILTKSGLLQGLLASAMEGGSTGELERLFDEEVAENPDDLDLQFRRLELAMASETPGEIRDRSFRIFQELLQRKVQPLPKKADSSGQRQSIPTFTFGMFPSGAADLPETEKKLYMPMQARSIADPVVRTLFRQSGGSGHSYMQSLFSSLGKLAEDDPAAVAFAWYAALAAYEDKKEEALNGLVALFDKEGLTPAERIPFLITFGASEPLDRTLRAYFAANEKATAIDRLCLSAMTSEPFDGEPDPGLLRALLDRTRGEGPEWKNHPQMRTLAMNAIDEPERARKLMREWAKHADVADYPVFSQLIMTALRLQDLDAFRIVLDRTVSLPEDNAQAWPGGRSFYPISILFSQFQKPSGESYRIAPDDWLPYFDAAMRARAGLPSGSASQSGFPAGVFLMESELPLMSSRALGAQETWTVRRALETAAREGKMDRMVELLEKQARDAAPDSRDVPKMLVAAARFMNGDRENALTEFRELARKSEDPAFDLMEARALKRMGENEKALAVLEKIPESAGDDYQIARLLQVQVLADLDQDEKAVALAKELSGRGAKLGQQERYFLQNILRNVEGAAGTVPIVRQSSGGRSTTSEDVSKMRDLDKAGKTDEAVAIAKRLLDLDPFAASGNNTYGIESALRLLKSDVLREKIGEWEAVLDRAPTSNRQLYLLAKVYDFMGEDVNGRSTHREKIALPVWVRLVRKGNEFRSFFSETGETWEEVGKAEIPMAGKVCVGFAMTSHDSKKLGVSYIEEAEVDGAVAPAEDANLPDGWKSEDIGEVGVPGTASIADGKVELRGAGRDITGRFDSFHYVYKILDGDGAIAARVTRLDNTNPWAKSGVMMRESLERDSRFAMTMATPDSKVAFQNRAVYHRGAEYWKRLADARPNDFRTQAQHAEALSSRGDNEAAIAIYEMILKRQPEEALRSASRLTRVYDAVGRMDELVAFSKSYSAPRTGSNYAYVNLVRSIAQRLSSKKRTDEALALLDEATKRVGEQREASDLEKETMRILAEAGYKDRARDFLRGLLVPEGKTDERAARRVSGAEARRGLNNGISHHDYGFVAAGDRYLKWLVEFDLLEEVAGALEKESPGKDLSMPQDYMRMGVLIAARRPGVLPEVKRAIQDVRARPDDFDGLAGFYLCIDGLLSWPEGRAVGIEWLEEMAKRKSTSRSSSRSALYPSRLLYQERLTDGDEEGTMAALRLACDALVAEIKKNNGLSSSNHNDSIIVINGLLARNLAKEGAMLFAALEPHGTNSYGPATFKSYQAEQAFSEGKENAVAKVWKVADGKQRHAIAYELSPDGEGIHTGFLVRQMVMGRASGPLDGKVDLEILAGPSSEDLDRVVKIPKVKNQGVWKGKLPEGARYIQAALHRGNGDVRTTKAVPIAFGPNLLPPPEVKPVASALRNELVGWEVPDDTVVRKFPCEILPGAEAISCATRKGGVQVLVGKKVEIDPAKTYLLSGWVRSYTTSENVAGLGIRFLDGDRKVISEHLPVDMRVLHWKQANRILAPDGGEGVWEIPKNARSAQPLVRMDRYADFSQLYLGEL